MVPLASLLQVFVEELRRKNHVIALIKGWERKVGIITEEPGKTYCLLFRADRVEMAAWPDDAAPDLVLRGTERDLFTLFAGEELSYLHAKNHIETRGTVRDQLKLEALIRLVAAGEGGVHRC
jgi:hypothetical protein